MNYKAHELLQRINSSNGREYLNRTYYRSFTLNVFSGNAEALKLILSDFSRVDDHIQRLTNKNLERDMQIFREIARLFHNFLAGAMTLVDHTRVFIEEFYLGTNVNREFKGRIQRDFVNNGLTYFVQDLRNYMMHRGMPPITHNLMMKQIEGGVAGEMDATSQFNLPIIELKEWRNWRRASKEFIESYEKYIDIFTLVNEYSKIIYKFQDDLSGLLTEYHKDDLEELDALEEAFREENRKEELFSLSPD